VVNIIPKFGQGAPPCLWM